MPEKITCQSVYDAALALLGEPDAARCTDYAGRAPYIIAAFCAEAEPVDAALRDADSPTPQFSSVAIELTVDFPLSDRLVPLAAAYLAAMLVLDENEELSDKLFERYCDGMSTLCAGIPAVSEKITDIYGY